MKLIPIWMELWIKEMHVIGVVKNPIFTLKNLNMVKKKQFVQQGNWTFLSLEMKMVKLGQLTVLSNFKEKISPNISKKRN